MQICGHEYQDLWSSCAFPLALTGWQCGELNGDYLGDSTDCSGTPCQEPPGTGACCIYDGMGNGSCTLTIETDCDEVGGQYYGDGTGCNDILCDVIPVGACCFTNGDCMDSIDLNECKAMGGIFQSDADCNGTSCFPDSGACCWMDGTCSDMSIQRIAPMPAVFSIQLIAA